ncbi:hypothetical protein Tco_0213383 [Tanacetum coccineum]
MSDSEECEGLTAIRTVSSLYEDLSDIGSQRADDHELLEPPYMLEDTVRRGLFSAPHFSLIMYLAQRCEQAHPHLTMFRSRACCDEIVAGAPPYEDEDDDMDIETDEEDEDDEMDIEMDEEEHLAPAYPVVVALPATAPSAEETEPFETDESAATPHSSEYRMNARISIPGAITCSAWSDSEVARLLALSSPQHHPLSPREGRPEVNLPPRMGLGLALGPGYEVGESSAAAAARPAGGHRADYGFVATMDRLVRRDPERYVGYGITDSWVGYGITDSWDEIVETLQGAPVSTDTELGAHMREFESMVRRDTDEIYTRLDDEQGQRQLLAGRVNMLFRDRRTHAHTRQLMETEAGMSREAWGRAMDASDLAHGEVISLCTTVHAQMSEITELQSADLRRQRAMSDLLETDRRRREEMRELRAADRTRQQQIIQTLTVMQTLQREMIPLQGLVTTLQGQVTALQGQVMTLQGQVTALQGQQGPAGGPAPPELPEEAGSSS